MTKRGSKEAGEHQNADVPFGAINGFREDVYQLVNSYVQLDSSRLVDFVGLWERARFGHVFA